MKPYGVVVIDSPDVADIKEMGSKGRAGQFAGKSGDYHPYSSGEDKAATRRYWARRARRQGKNECEHFDEGEVDDC